MRNLSVRDIISTIITGILRRLKKWFSRRSGSLKELSWWDGTNSWCIVVFSSIFLNASFIWKIIDAFILQWWFFATHSIITFIYFFRIYRIIIRVKTFPILMFLWFFLLLLRLSRRWGIFKVRIIFYWIL
jgi:hypothetical protein